MVESKKEKPQIPKLTTKNLTNMAFAYKQSGTLVGALELDLFTMISKGINNISDLSENLDLPLEIVDKLITACTALGLLEKREDGYYNSPEVDRYLVRGKPKHYGDYLVHQAKTEYNTWKDLVAAIRRPYSQTGLYQTMMQDAEFARALTVAGYNSSIAAGHKLAREFDFSPYELFLDLGGGSGCYSIPAVRNNPNLHAIVFDFPTVCTVTEEFVAKAGLTDRITTQTGNFMTDEFPSGADLVGIIGNLHAYSLDETEFVVKKAFNAINSGGGMIIIDYMLNDDKTGPLEAAFHHLGTVATSSGGYVKSTAEMTEFMKQAGAVDIAVHDFIPGSMSRVTGIKPG